MDLPVEVRVQKGFDQVHLGARATLWLPAERK